jgi:hypothetical protein
MSRKNRASHGNALKTKGQFQQEKVSAKINDNSFVARMTLEP